MINELKFRAMGVMADRNKDIRLSNTLTECRSVKAGGILSFGVDDATGRLIRKQMAGLQNTHIVVCLVLDAAEYEKTVQELKAQTGEAKEHHPAHTGIELIAQERKRQIQAEGWTSKMDDDHTREQLALASAVYAMPAKYRTKNLETGQVWGWPFAADWFKPTPDDRIRELQKAGALIAAEIDRLQRLKGNQ
jgi:hypothetical protein